ncbi:MAG: hypothetical protein U1F65_05795 [Verrucomicrobiota bacterium]
MKQPLRQPFDNLPVANSPIRPNFGGLLRGKGRVAPLSKTTRVGMFTRLRRFLRMKILHDLTAAEGNGLSPTPVESAPLLPSPAPQPGTSPSSAKPATPPDHEPDSTGSVSVKTSLLDKLRTAGRRLLSARGITAKRDHAGEPGELPLSDAPRLEAPAAGPAAPPADSAVASIFRRCCVSSVKSVIDILNGCTRIFAESADFEPKFIDRAIKTAEPTPEAISEFTESLDLVMKKHSVQPKHAEEFALGMAALNLGSGYAMMFAMFRGEIQRRRREALAAGGAK